MIASAVIKNIYVGNGSTTQFPFTFKYNSADDIKVALYDIPTDVQTDLTSDYYIDTEKSVVLYPGYQSGQEPPSNEQPEILPATKKIIVYRETPQSQEEDLGSRYPLTTLEKMVDKCTMLIQEASEKLDRSVKAPIGQDTEVDTQELEQMLAETVNARDKADTSADAAAQSEINAAQSVIKAVSASTQSGQYAQEAAASAETVTAPAYSFAAAYNFPNVVAYTDGFTYRCIGTNIIGDNPDTSPNWVRLAAVYDSFFDIDINGDLMPGLSPTYSSNFELDSNSDIMPRLAI